MDNAVCTFPGGVIRPIAPRDDAALAAIVRDNLRAFHLDIPGTAYFDPELEHLSRYYAADPAGRAYYVAVQGGQVLGGVGLARFEPFPRCAEVQKLYLADGAKGRGLGRLLMQTLQDDARSRGYERLYLETHTNLQAALALYEKLGFRPIPRPDCVFHSTMDRFYEKDL